MLKLFWSVCRVAWTEPLPRGAREVDAVIEAAS